MSQENFLTVDDAALRLKVTPYTVRKWMREGRIGGVKVGRLWRVPESALSRLAASATRLQPCTLALPDAPEDAA